MADVRVFLGNIAHCTKPYQLDLIEDGFVITKGRKIFSVGKQSDLASAKAKLTSAPQEEIRMSKSQLLIPGLIDTHIHAPQYPNSGLGYDKPLLEWLEHYTYKLEKQYRDLEFSKRVYEAVVRQTLNHGTTTACYFASLFSSSSLVLADAAIKFGQRAFVGKINMTTLAPDDYIETPDESIVETMKFIEALKNKETDLVQPIITPRFALSVDGQHMSELGKIAGDHKLNIQTHISENVDECNLVKTTYNHKPYARVYDDAQLLTPKTVLAHGIHLTDEECELIARRGTSISHCPESNTCLKSGICDVRRLAKFGINISLGTDVSGGPSPSIISAMRAALQASIHLSYSNKDYLPLTYKEAFYMATLGGAKALALDDRVGNFVEGKEFDALVIDMDQPGSPCDHLLDYNPMEILQRFIYLGDDRNITKVYVAGNMLRCK